MKLTYPVIAYRIATATTATIIQRIDSATEHTLETNVPLDDVGARLGWHRRDQARVGRIDLMPPAQDEVIA